MPSNSMPHPVDVKISDHLPPQPPRNVCRSQRPVQYRRRICTLQLRPYEHPPGSESIHAQWIGGSDILKDARCDTFPVSRAVSDTKGSCRNPVESAAHQGVYEPHHLSGGIRESENGDWLRHNPVFAAVSYRSRPETTPSAKRKRGRQVLSSLALRVRREPQVLLA